MGPIITYSNIALMVVQASGMVIGIWAILLVGVLNVSIFPIPRKGLVLHINGPYRWIRHPMYLAVLLFFIPIALHQATWLKRLLLLMLIADIIVKIIIEEKLLKMAIDGYNDYIKKTWRLIPFLF